MKLKIRLITFCFRDLPVFPAEKSITSLSPCLKTVFMCTANSLYLHKDISVSGRVLSLRYYNCKKGLCFGTVAYVGLR